MKKNFRHGGLRDQLIQECARLMMQEHIDDFQTAKNKAAQRLGFNGKQHLPSNQEIEQALQEYQRLFRKPQQYARLCEQRRAALEAMQGLQCYHPCLVGSILNGTANAHSDIELHLFAEPHEEIAIFLAERKIPYQIKERIYHSIQKTYPLYRLLAGEEYCFNLVVFPLHDQRTAPPDLVTGKPMRRADISTVQHLIAQECDP